MTAQPPVDALPTQAYASWLRRVGAYLIDYLLFLILAVILGVTGGLIVTAAGGSSRLDGIVDLLLTVAVLAYVIWNSGLPPRRHRLDHRQVGAEVQGDRRNHRPAHRLRVVDPALLRPLSGWGHLRYRLPAAVVHRQTADARGHDRGHRLFARRASTGGARPRTASGSPDGGRHRGAGRRGHPHGAGLSDDYQPVGLRR